VLALAALPARADMHNPPITGDAAQRLLEHRRDAELASAKRVELADKLYAESAGRRSEETVTWTFLGVCAAGALAILLIVSRHCAKTKPADSPAFLVDARARGSRLHRPLGHSPRHSMIGLGSLLALLQPSRRRHHRRRRSRSHRHHHSSTRM
jgi:hypothetical protein